MSLCGFDDEIRVTHNCVRLVGIDEAGRGPLAGPVTACAAYIPPQAYSSIAPFVNDSKKLSPKKREEAFFIMLEAGVKYGFGYATALQIDKLNILQATFFAMRNAVNRLVVHTGLNYSDALFLVDGPHKIRNADNLNQMPIIDGDAKSASVAAASIFAKVLRDRWLSVIDKKYTNYGFAAHKGYGTKEHLKNISLFGACPEHRMSFAPLRHDVVKPAESKKVAKEKNLQPTLF